MTVTADITDDLAGNAGPGFSSSPSQVRFVSPSGKQFKDALLDDTHRVSGTPTNGTVSYTMEIPRYAESGTWQIQSMLLVDQAGNTRSVSKAQLDARGFPTTFNQTGLGDATAPNLTAFDFNPKSVNTAGAPQDITVTATITDDLAGNAGTGFSSSPSQVRFVSPSGQQFDDALLDDTHRVSGTPTNGTVSYSMQLPQFAEQGTWRVQSMLLVDQAGNTRSLSAQQLTSMGFPTTFTNGP